VAFFGHQQNKYDVNWLSVRGIEVNTLFQRQQHTDRFRGLVDPAMGDGYTITQSGAAKLFAGNKIHQQRVGGQGLPIEVYLLRGQLQQTFFAGDVSMTERSRLIDQVFQGWHVNTRLHNRNGYGERPYF